MLTGGTILQTGARDLVFGEPRHEYPKRLLTAVPTIDPEWEAARLRNAAARAEEVS